LKNHRQIDKHTMNKFRNQKLEEEKTHPRATLHTMEKQGEEKEDVAINQRAQVLYFSLLLLASYCVFFLLASFYPHPPSTSLRLHHYLVLLHS